MLTLHLSAKVAREIDFCIDEISARKFRQALTRLCRLRGIRTVPELREKARPVIQRLAPRVDMATDDELQTRLRTAHENIESLARDMGITPAQLRRDLLETLQRQARSLEPVTPLVKPTKRHVDRDLLAEFRARYSTCCVRGCGQAADPHHLVLRSDHGSDAHENLIPLCLFHHTGRDGWHTLTTDGWIQKHAGRLSTMVMLKIRLARETEIEAKIGARDAMEDG